MSVDKIKLLLPLTMLLIGLYIFPVSIFKTDFSRIPGDLADARFNNYILEHDYLFFTHKSASYWNAPFMFPFKNVIAFSDNLLGSSPVYSAFRLCGFCRETSFQLWMIALFILNFCFCYFALLKWSRNNILSAVGAYMFAFSILLVGNIYNAQTLPRFIIPFVFYWSYKYFTVRHIKYFLFTGLGISFQFYCGIYLGFLLLYTLIFFTTGYFICYKDDHLISQFKERKTLIRHLLVLALIGITFYPLMKPYLNISIETGTPSYAEVFSTIPQLTSYFFTSGEVVVWNFLYEYGKSSFENWWCHLMFIGALPWLGILAVPVAIYQTDIAKNDKSFLIFLLTALFLTFIFCLRVSIFSLYKYIYLIPGFSVMRSMNRLINIEIFLFILIFVFVFKVLSKNKWIRKLILLFPILVIIDNAVYPDKFMTYNKSESQEEIGKVQKFIARNHKVGFSAIAYMPFEFKNNIFVQLDAMLACQQLNIPCVNAYTGHNPDAFDKFKSDLNHSGFMEWCDYNDIEPDSIQQITYSNK